MRILLIACSYPPDPFVGAFRAAKVARALQEAGHRVDVVTARLPDETDAVRSSEPNLTVHTVREMPGPRTAYRAVKSRLSRAIGAGNSNGSAAGDSATGSRAGAGRQHHVPRWKRYLLSAISVPDDRQGFIPAALRKARVLMKDEVDLVYTTAPPFSDHLVGLALKRATGVRWVAEFRDPWTENVNRQPHTRSQLMDSFNGVLEMQCVRAADQIVAVSAGTAELLRSKLSPADRDRVILALNGIDNLVPAAQIETRSKGPFRILHIGNCYAGRDPRLFLRALAAVARRRNLTAFEVEVEFIGNCRRYQGESLEELAGDLGIGSLVRFADWLPQEEARARARKADLFLLPFPYERGIIPNKLYDYLGFRKPILAFLDAEGEPARMLREVGGHFLVTEQDQSKAEQALEAALAGRGRPLLDDAAEAVLYRWTTENQMQQLLSALDLTGT